MKRLPSLRLIPEAKTRIRSNFSYVMNVSGINPRTGRRNRANIGIRSSVNLTREALNAETDKAVAAAKRDDPSNLVFKIDNYTLIEAVRRAGV